MSKKKNFSKGFMVYAESTAKELQKGLAAGFFTASTLFSMFTDVSSGENGASVVGLVKEITNVISAVEEQRVYSPKGLGEHYRVTGEIQYIVRAGDTVHTIARDMKRDDVWITPEQVIEGNNLTPPHYYF